MLSPRSKRIIYRVIPFGLIWLISGWVFLLVESAASANFSQLPETAIKMDAQLFILSSLAIAGVGLLVGFIELRYLDNIFASQRFALKFFYKLLVYTLFFLLIVFVTFPLAASLELNTSLLDRRVWDKYFDYFVSMTHLSTGVQLGVALAISLFYSEISEFIGQGALLNFFVGKYHSPIEEERIFMFLDMNSSTTIAERLGHVEYFKLLREYYACLSDAIIEHEGEIYQYVGDEIIVSWKYQAEAANSRCLACFFAMQDSLMHRENWFIERFGMAPTFKAGLHFGKVTTGEIGVIKKEIFFTGDVLNATARIQGLCNTYSVPLLLSARLMQQINLSSGFVARYLGEAELRGRAEKIGLYTVVQE